jgi:hypothetical protein
VATKSPLGRFAHLVGFRPSAAKGKAVETETEEDREEEDETTDAEADEPGKGEEDEPDSKKKGAKKKAAGADADDEGDDDTDAEETTDNMKKAIRMRERARCAAIFSDPAAAANPGLAATVAFSTNLTRSEAVAVLRAGGATAEAPAPKKSSLDRRMSSEPRGGVTAGSPQGPTPGSAKELAERMTAVGKVAGIAA